MKYWHSFVSLLCVLTFLGLVACESVPDCPEGQQAVSQGGDEWLCTPTDGADTVVGGDTTTTTAPPSDTKTGPTDATSGDLNTAKAIQEYAEVVGCDPSGISLVSAGVSLKGLIVTSPKYDAFTPEDPTKTALDGYFVADAGGGPFAAIRLTIPRTEESNYVPGDVLDVSGDAEEFFCLTQIKVISHAKSGTGDIPAAATVATADFATEENESRLVKLENVEVLEKFSWGGFRVTGDIEVAWGMEGFFLSLTVGNTYNLTGVVQYAYSKYQLLPRSDGDIELVGGMEASITSMQSSDASKTCTEKKIQNISEGLTIEGTVAHERFDVTDKLDGYYLSDGTQEPYSGVYMVVSKDKATNFALGTQLKVVGGHTEYYCLTELYSSTVEEVGTGGTVPDAVTTTVDDLMADPEKWEGMLITVTGLTVSNVDDLEKYGYFEVNGTGLLVESKLMGKDGIGTPAVDATYVSITGFLSFSFDQYRLQPRSLADMVQ
jgi:hypothetical protein